MTSFGRKVRRKQNKYFMKEFKKSMKKFKEMVKCSSCGKEPKPGENIDDWHINKNSEKIDLMCVECNTLHGAPKEEQSSEDNIII